MAIFSKMLKLPKDAVTESKAMTLMVADVQRIATGLSYFHELWATVIEAAVFTYLLQNRVGISSLAVAGLAIGMYARRYFSAAFPCIPLQSMTWRTYQQRAGPNNKTIVCVLLSTVISKYASREQQKWLHAVQTRLRATQKMLSSLKAIKMMGMEMRVHRLVSNLRLDEMKAAKPFRKLLTITAALCEYSSPFLPAAPFFSFVFFE